MESNTIPVIENKDGYLATKLPPEYLASPMLIVDDWADAPRLIAQLANDPAALDARQRALTAWCGHGWLAPPTIPALFCFLLGRFGFIYMKLL